MYFNFRCVENRKITMFLDKLAVIRILNNNNLEINNLELIFFPTWNSFSFIYSISYLSHIVILNVDINFKIKIFK